MTALSLSILCLNVLLTGCQPAAESGLLFASARSGNWEIFLQAKPESEPRNLTRYPSVDRYPDWSPDRRELVFASDRNGSFDLYLLDADGNNLRLLTESPYPDTTPRWSPQGIVFVSEREDRNEELYLIDPDTKALRRLTQDPAADYDPAWLPDGSGCVFISLRSGKPELYRLSFSAGAAGESVGEPEQLTRDGADKRSPDVSPDGKTLVFSMRQGPNWNLVSLDLSSNKLSPLTTAAGWEGMPRWRQADNGQNPQSLIYASDQAGKRQLMELTPAGKTRSLLAGPGPDREGSWP